MTLVLKTTRGHPSLYLFGFFYFPVVVTAGAGSQLFRDTNCTMRALSGRAHKKHHGGFALRGSVGRGGVAVVAQASQAFFLFVVVFGFDFALSVRVIF